MMVPLPNRREAFHRAAEVLYIDIYSDIYICICVCMCVYCIHFIALGLDDGSVGMMLPLPNRREAFHRSVEVNILIYILYICIYI